MQDKTFNRDDFMSFFRDENALNTLSNDDRIEIFKSILAGSSDLTVTLLDELLKNYNASEIIVLDAPSLEAQPIPSSAITALEKVRKFCQDNYQEEQRLFEEDGDFEHSFRTDAFDEVQNFVEGLMQ